jgi:hypothetical protein
MRDMQPHSAPTAYLSCHLHIEDALNRLIVGRGDMPLPHQEDVLVLEDGPVAPVEVGLSVTLTVLRQEAS